jgi:hypothetical protein
MERKALERRTVLKGGAAAFGLIGSGASAATVAAKPAAGEAAQSQLPEQILTAVERFRATIPDDFEPDYVEHAVIPFFLTSFYEGERPMLPMIDVNFSKENALPYDLWGLIYHDWRPTPEEGVTVFLQGLEKRGDNNLRKRIYFSGVTPDLYKPIYGAKVAAFFDKILDQQFANKPFMRHYLDYYFDLYWDLHLGVTGDDIPFEVRQIGEAFNTVLAYRNPLLPVTHDNYMKVRELLDFLKSWIDERIGDIQSGKMKNPEKTMAWYRLKNAGDGSHFGKKDVVLACFHKFVALNQWGNTIFGIMSRLAEDGGDPAVRTSFQKTMSGNFDGAGGAPFTPLELFVMELFRMISPNGGSISVIRDARASAYGASPQQRFGLPLQRHSYVSTPHNQHQLRSGPLEGSEHVRSATLSARSHQWAGQRRQVPADRFGTLSIRRHQFRGEGRAQGQHHQQRFRHGVCGRRRHRPSGLRLCRFRTVRLWLSPLPGRAIDHPGLRGFSAQSLARQDRVSQAELGKSRPCADWA